MQQVVKVIWQQAALPRCRIQFINLLQLVGVLAFSVLLSQA